MPNPTVRDQNLMYAPAEGEVTLVRANLADWQSGDHVRRRTFVDAVCAGFQDSGFCLVESPELTEELMARVEDVTGRVFSLHEDVLAKYVRPKYQRGYAPQGAEHAVDNAESDLKRFLMIRDPEVPEDLNADMPFGNNVEISEVPELLPVCYEFMAVARACGNAILGALELGFLAEGKLVPNVVGAETIFRPICYDPLPEMGSLSAWRSAPHEDINLVTIMPARRSLSGLDLLVDRVWRSVVAPANGFVCDVGEMLTEVPEFRHLKATTHRVRNPPEGPARKVPRYAYPVFVHGRMSWVVREEDGNPVRYAESFMRRINAINGV